MLCKFVLILDKPGAKTSPNHAPHTEMQAAKGGGFVYPSSEFPDALVWVLQRNRISGSLKILSWQAGHPGEPVE